MVQVKREKLREEYKNLALSMQPNYFVTLATNDFGSVSETTRVLGKFCAMMDRALLGHRWHKAPEQERVDGVFFIEHTRSNIHAHGLLRVPEQEGEDMAVLIARKWNRLTEAGSTDVQSIHDAYGVAEYVTKELKSFTFDQDQMVLASQFWGN